MHSDISLCPVSLADAHALDAWNGVILGVLAHSQSTGDHLGRLITAAPDWAMGHAMKGLACLMLGRGEMRKPARAAAEAAKKALRQGGATPRERLWCQALEDWLEGKPSMAIARMEAALQLNPTDAISMKLSHGIRFILGDNVGMLESVERVLGAYRPSHPLYGYVLGCHAFALEEFGNYALAERVGKRGLEFAADDAWGLHAVAHVYDMTNCTDAGIALIDNNQAAWSHCNNFRFHVWWHKALLHLDQGDVATVLDLYDTKIRDEKTDDYRDFSNASSLLMRLELEGHQVGHRWDELAALADKRSTDGTLTFADLHYMLALMGDPGGKAATQLKANVAAAAQKSGEMAQVMASPGMSAAEGLLAFGGGNYTRAFAHLKSAQPQFQTIGGSHAQRDVFERLTIEAGLRAGQHADTKALIYARTAVRGGHLDAFAERCLTQIEELQAFALPLAAAE